ncbi:MAG: DUF3226 domain-containing protein [Candidatus Poribacteria bacterium]
MDEEINSLRSKLAELGKENEKLTSKLAKSQEENIEIRKSKILIVEGIDEKNFFETWLKELNRNDIQVMPVGGKENLKPNFKLIVDRPNFGDVESILITRDADYSYENAFRSVCGILQDRRVIESLINKGINLQIPESAWTFTKNTVPRICVAILPGINQTGALEELLLQTIDDDPMSDKSHNFIDDAKITLDNSDYRPSPPPHRIGKAKVHAFLSTFDKPDRRQGEAANAGVWNFEHKALDPLRSILEEL